MIILGIILSLLLLGIIATLIRYYPSYKWNHTCRALFEYFENGYLDNLHNLIDTVGPDLNRMFETSCLEDIDKEVKKFMSQQNYFIIDESCVRGHVRRYKEDVLNHIMRNKHKIEE